MVVLSKRHQAIRVGKAGERDRETVEDERYMIY
ncbi:hypothetical protein EV200_109129 [Pedobacter psychrotolerans]|uniref:Uncharacterized protein n=1 Tax=Pedobacter psychrotolerans TaxID=1843235 RepID=A0A4R2H431_9SPHI|nr:hypothetical protein EV200_109129 [Pedobacter psychrotolerans]